MRTAITAVFLSIMALVALSSRIDPSFLPDAAYINTSGLSPDFKSPAPQTATDAVRAGLRSIHEAVDFGQPIQIYGVNLSGIETIDPSKKNAVDSIISLDSFWEYPLMDSKGKVVHIATVNPSLTGSWESPSIVYNGWKELESHFAPPIMDGLKEQGFPEAADIKRFRIEILGLDFFYIDGPEEQYLVPFEIFSPFTKRNFGYVGAIFLDVESERIYPAAEIMAMVIDWKTSVEYGNDYGGIGGGRHFRKSTVTAGAN